MKLTKKTLFIAALIYLVVGFAFIVIKGSVCTLSLSVDSGAGSAEDYQVELEQDHEVVRLTGKRLENGTLYLDFRSVSPGRAFVSVTGPKEYNELEILYVHHFGIITEDNYLGQSSGAWILPTLVSAYMALLLWYVTAQYRRGRRESMYQYRNVRNLGWSIFLSLMLLGQIQYFVHGRSVLEAVRSTLSSASSVAYIVFPLAFVTSILVSVSNVQLMKKEGRNWRNMLGFMLGLLICISTLFPLLLSEWLQRTTLVDVHNQQGLALYVEMIVTNSILMTVSYLDCILLGTIILGVKAAKAVPAFDKDYILILGCQIKKDGSLTPLLKGRADRAIEFARMQREKTGKGIVFVPSGGKGPDEVMPEAQAIRNYLLECGIVEDSVLTEDQSADTYENFRNSLELIRENCGESEPKIAFSTTNYHVFRSGILARQQGCFAEGIGSVTRSYFWINAFIREFIATLYAEWKSHLRVIAVMNIAIVLLVLTVYISNVM